MMPYNLQEMERDDARQLRSDKDSERGALTKKTISSEKSDI
jgi:hypothetical protein